jgi:putative ABC transport system permease protein
VIIARFLLQTVVLAFGQLWANRIRAVLTALGIVIGVASTIGTVAATSGLKGYVLKEFAAVGASRVWVFPRRPRDQPTRFSQNQIRMKLSEADGMLAACPSLALLTPIKQFVAPVQYGDRVSNNVSVQGIRPSWHEIEQRFVTEGRQFVEVDDRERRNVCYVNDKAIEELNLPASASGTTILVEGRRFLIVGVVETKAVSPMFGGGEARTEIFIPYGTADAMKPEPMFGLYVAATTTRPELFDDAKAEVKFYMRNKRGLTGDDPDTFGVEAIEQFITQFKNIAAGITALAAGLVVISLLVGGIGIMNIMLASVSERTREIGLRKAVGAPPAVILMQFLVEAVVLCLVGAAIGLAIGYGIALGMIKIPGSPLSEAEVPLWAVMLSVGFSAGTGVIFGLFPAIKAARLDPIVALRHE